MEKVRLIDIMLKTLSYFNIFFAVIYFMEYLQNSSYWVISGLITVIIYNWLILLQLESGKPGIPGPGMPFGAAAFCYAVYTAFNALKLSFSAIEEDYLDRAMTILCMSALVAAGCIFGQLLISALNHYSKKSD